MISLADAIVSVRVPLKLVEELKRIVKEEHFMDLSEAVRSIVRYRYTRSEDPGAYEMKRLRSEIKQVIAGQSKENLVRELKKIIEELKYD